MYAKNKTDTKNFKQNSWLANPKMGKKIPIQICLLEQDLPPSAHSATSHQRYSAYTIERKINFWNSGDNMWWELSTGMFYKYFLIVKTINDCRH